MHSSEDGLRPIPHVPRDLVEHLSACFPDRCASPADSDRQIWIKAGARSVVDYLLHHLVAQEENILLSPDR